MPKSAAVKQSVYMPQELRAAIEREGKRLERSMAWLVQRCVRRSIAQLRELPSQPAFEREAAE